MHRFAQGALVALIAGIGIFVVPAAAQTNPPTPPTPPTPPPVSQCAAVQTLPTMPDGATATRAVMDSYNTTYNAWVASSRSTIECRRNETNQMRAAAQPSVDAFNAVTTRVNSINDYWTALVAYLNANSGAGDANDTHEAIRGSESVAEGPQLPDVAMLGSGAVAPASGTCAAIPAPPPPANPERTTAQVRRAVDNYNTWYTAARESVTCRHTATAQAAAGADALITEYNAVSTQINESSRTWAAEVAEFNAR